jgi:hypothetical protein
MAAGRIAAVLLAASLLTVAGAQQSSQTHLTVQVTDMTGALVPGARIKIDPTLPSDKSSLVTDSQGRATLDLPPGSYTLSITFTGFKEWTRQVEVQRGSVQVLPATLEVAPTPCDPCGVFVWVPDIPVESPEPAFLPLQPISNLAPLPSHSPKKR